MGKKDERRGDAKAPKKDRQPKHEGASTDKASAAYNDELYGLHVELLKLQNHIKEQGQRLLLIFEGRDAAGKGGLIKRFIKHLNPRGIRVVALSKPSDIESTQWYFQRYVAHLPAAGEIVLMDRSWYNRAMVEPVMGFCTDEQNKRFLKDVPDFEQLLVKDGIRLFKFYLSISREEQQRRFEERKSDALKQYKYSPVDARALEFWDAYTVKKFQMLSESNRTISPWTIIRSDSKKKARLNAFKVVLHRLDYEGKIEDALLEPDPKVAISGIDEIKHMEEFLFHKGKLMG